MKPLANVQEGRDPPYSDAGFQRLQPSLLEGLLLLALAVVVSGCATPALWKHTAARSWSPECTPDQFFTTLSTGRQEVIVVFRQSAWVGEKNHYRLVAWNLSQPSTELTVGRRAVRQLTNACDWVEVMPSFSFDAVPANVPSCAPGYAVTGPQQRQFRVHLDGVSSELFTLPCTDEKRRTLTRVAVLPLAVTADAAIVGALCCAFAGYAGGSVGLYGH